ncbi:hypothetical protein THAOC_20175 [Thalassiosira oceanica]|uniref:ERCC1-like central domain-containing protein n=1 Tax=Thalassiosira oceanica TaxID=159749 RepID=K0S2X1_THAOC|nr:hypothetical protein THAOC_20175 [Thalassiosira oceanica]|eukprot:EJK59580.1 hypothetical protein THAOC_20175 [Thalassiosira oceanica]
MPVTNPYAKKKQTTAPVVLPTSNGSRPAISAKPHASNGPPVIPSVLESTTFSQAFNEFDPDAGFGEEEKRAQLAFEEEVDPNNIGEDSSGITARDHHSMLSAHVLHISQKQKGNPVLLHIRNVPHKFSPMVPDYIFAPTRIAELKNDFEFRMLLCLVDLEDNTNPILFLNDLSVQNNLTLILAWSEQEAARYLETVKAFDGKDLSMIQKREFTNHIDKVSHALSSVRSVNKTDAGQLLNQFGTFKSVVNASLDELSVCPGIGPKKVARLHDAFHRPFNSEMKKRAASGDKKAAEQSKGKDDSTTGTGDAKRSKYSAAASEV